MAVPHHRKATMQYPVAPSTDRNVSINAGAMLAAVVVAGFIAPWQLTAALGALLAAYLFLELLHRIVWQSIQDPGRHRPAPREAAHQMLSEQ